MADHSPRTEGGPLVALRNVRKDFTTGKGTHTALDGIDLEVRRGSILAVIGHSGAGKSTLARLMNGLEKPSSGEVRVDGVDIARLTERQLRPVRMNIGMIFQQFNLFSTRTVAGNVEYPLHLAGWDKPRRAARVAELLEFVGLADKAGSYPAQLSGGQKQRVGIARALATSPSLLLADESTSALDPETTRDVLELLRKVNRELGVTIVVITHEMEVVRTIADEVAVLDAGKVAEQGPVFDVFTRPRSDTARTFVSTVLRDAPDEEDLRRLRARHTGRLVKCTVLDDARGGHSRFGPVLSRAARDHGVAFDFVYGGIESLRGRSFGSLWLELDGPAAGVDAVIAELSEATEVEEIH